MVQEDEVRDGEKSRERLRSNEHENSAIPSNSEKSSLGTSDAKLADGSSENSMRKSSS